MAKKKAVEKKEEVKQEVAEAAPKKKRGYDDSKRHDHWQDHEDRLKALEEAAGIESGEEE